MGTDMDAAQLRKQIQQCQCELGDVLRGLKGRRALIRGSVYMLRRKCGKAVCRCQDGHRHESWVLSVPDKGRKRLRTVPKGKRASWQEMSERYRQFRRGRARLVKLFAEILRLVDDMERERTVPPPQ